ncbi:hypothetical protein ACFXA3_27980 [Streptomyces sp. NPDC059456]|uniref:hypothetical protein n=1 Tax=Streptomyces sp. NPDC059456 TaxID=3346838 RepID=UPI0036815F3F
MRWRTFPQALSVNFCSAVRVSHTVRVDFVSASTVSLSRQVPEGLGLTGDRYPPYISGVGKAWASRGRARATSSTRVYPSSVLTAAVVPSSERPTRWILAGAVQEPVFVRVSTFQNSTFVSAAAMSVCPVASRSGKAGTEPGGLTASVAHW